MSDVLRRWRRLVIAAAAVVALAAGGAVLAKVGAPDPTVREIRLVVREMTYYVAETGDANPTLRLIRGEPFDRCLCKSLFCRTLIINQNRMPALPPTKFSGYASNS